MLVLNSGNGGWSLGVAEWWGLTQMVGGGMSWCDSVTVTVTVTLTLTGTLTPEISGCINKM